MTTFVWIVYVIAVIVMLLGLTLLQRNVKVREFRISLIDKVYDLSRKDIDSDKIMTPYWRFDEYEKVSYEKMLYTFWKNLTPENYYKDLTFLQ